MCRSIVKCGVMCVLPLLCLVVCLTLLASSFLPSHLSLKHVHVLVDILHTAMYLFTCIYTICDNVTITSRGFPVTCMSELEESSRLEVVQ